MPTHLPSPVKPQKLVENRRIFGGNDVEFSIYDTYQQAQKVELTARNPLYCGMITGKKIIHFDHGEALPFLPNESLIVPSNETILIDFPDAVMHEPTQCITIEIDADKVQEIVSRLNEQFPRMPDSGDWKYEDARYAHFQNTARFNQNLDQIIHCFTDQQPYRDMLIDLNTSRLIIHMLQSEARKVLLNPKQTQGNETTLSRVIEFIKINISRRIKMTELEKIACVSKATLFRYFQNELGCSPIEFINAERMKEAAKKLTKGFNVTETCYDLGYRSQTHFIDTFKKYYGTTPHQYKKNKRLSST